MRVARVIFLFLVVFFSWLSLRKDWGAVLNSLELIALWQTLVATALVFLGLILTGHVWGKVLASFGHQLSVRSSFSVFCLGQLGKYLPGSIWSITAQSDLARKHGIPVRTTVATGLIFLYWNVLSCAILALGLAFIGIFDFFFEPWVYVFGFAALFLGIIPRFVNFLAKQLAGGKQTTQTRAIDVLLFLVIMSLVWLSYGSAVFIILTNSLDEVNRNLFLLSLASFAVSFLFGVITPIAPAGLGVREASLIFLLSPAVGLASASALAILIRLIHTVADFSLAVVYWPWDRKTGTRKRC
jgi:uncharacterized membrane protein YbhN (UPF0104 family)